MGCRNLLIEGGNELTKNLLKRNYLINFTYLKVQKYYQNCRDKEFNTLKIYRKL